MCWLRLFFLEFCKVKRVITLCGKSEVWHRIPILLTCFLVQVLTMGKNHSEKYFWKMCNVLWFATCCCYLFQICRCRLCILVHTYCHVCQCEPYYYIPLYGSVILSTFHVWDCSNGGDPTFWMLFCEHARTERESRVRRWWSLYCWLPQCRNFFYFCLLRYQSVLFPVMYSLFHMCVRRLCWCKQL